jgi:hypothetical protein
VVVGQIPENLVLYPLVKLTDLHKLSNVLFVLGIPGNAGFFDFTKGWTGILL